MSIKEVRLKDMVNGNVVNIVVGEKHIDFRFGYAARKSKSKAVVKSRLEKDASLTAVKAMAIAIQLHLDGSHPENQDTYNHALSICRELTCPGEHNEHS